MTDEAIFLAVLGAIVVGFIGGYSVGYYTRSLVNKIRTLESRKDTPEPTPEPAITLGSYIPPKGVSTATDGDNPVGIAEPKTPQRVEYEAEQEIEAEGRGFKQ